MLHKSMQIVHTCLEIPAYNCPKSVIFSECRAELNSFLLLQLWAAVIVLGPHTHTKWFVCSCSHQAPRSGNLQGQDTQLKCTGVKANLEQTLCRGEWQTDQEEQQGAIGVLGLPLQCVPVSVTLPLQLSLVSLDSAE